MSGLLALSAVKHDSKYILATSDNWFLPALK